MKKLLLPILIVILCILCMTIVSAENTSFDIYTIERSLPEIVEERTIELDIFMKINKIESYKTITYDFDKAVKLYSIDYFALWCKQGNSLQNMVHYIKNDMSGGSYQYCYLVPMAIDGASYTMQIAGTPSIGSWMIPFDPADKSAVCSAVWNASVFEKLASENNAGKINNITGFAAEYVDFFVFDCQNGKYVAYINNVNDNSFKWAAYDQFIEECCEYERENMIPCDAYGFDLFVFAMSWEDNKYPYDQKDIDNMISKENETTVPPTENPSETTYPYITDDRGEIIGTYPPEEETTAPDTDSDPIPVDSDTVSDTDAPSEATEKPEDKESWFKGFSSPLAIGITITAGIVIIGGILYLVIANKKKK